MNIQFTARHFKARPELQQYAEETVQRLTQFYDGIVTAEVVLEEEARGGGKQAEISLRVYKETLFAKESSNDYTASINACVDKLERQLRKYKDKLTQGRQPGERPAITDVLEQERAKREDDGLV
jgi:putative sigma-54 modulation protein